MIEHLNVISNDSGFMDADFSAKWGIVDFDWWASILCFADFVQSFFEIIAGQMANKTGPTRSPWIAKSDCLHKQRLSKT
jgi:hypothetical protein